MSKQKQILGVVGGVGPSATVDFLDKIIRNTPASRDQDHIRMIVDHDPTIPDRTAYLLGEGPDPTASLEAACKRLEAYGAGLIAIPCNTAHAFIEPIQRDLSIPIINMLLETAQYIEDHHNGLKTIGLLVILGCTELPLLSARIDINSEGNESIPKLEPGEILARKCVKLCSGLGKSHEKARKSPFCVESPQLIISFSSL